MSTHRFLFAISVLGVGCSGSSSLGSNQDPITNAGGAGSTSAGAGGTAVTAGMGGGAEGGTKASGGTGGTTAGSAGMGTGATGSAGLEPGSGDGGASAGTGGGTADGGTSGMPAAGSGGTTSGTAGMDMGQAGEGPIGIDTPKAVEDPDATGDGPCASRTARDVLDAIHEAYPEFADITDFYDPMSIGASQVVYPYTSGAGYSMVLARGSGDCPAGCISWDYYYFQTDESCTPGQVGFYYVHFDPANCYRLEGEPMWGNPDHTPTVICPSTT